MALPSLVCNQKRSAILSYHKIFLADRTGLPFHQVMHDTFGSALSLPCFVLNCMASLSNFARLVDSQLVLSIEMHKDHAGNDQHKAQ